MENLNFFERTVLEKAVEFTAVRGLDLGGMIDTAATPKETGIPQRGARPRAFFVWARLTSASNVND